MDLVAASVGVADGAGRYAMTDGVLEHIAIMEIGNLIVPFAFVAISAAKIWTGNKRLF
jgi:hypothetical protein